MKTFEYKIADNDQRSPDCKSLPEFLNEQGAQGWEMVNYHMHNNGIQSMIFKREQITLSRDQIQNIIKK